MPNDIANNMADTINQLDEQIKELEAKHWDECRQIAHYDDEIKRLEAAAVKPVKHGQWIEVSPKHSRCSVCDTTCLIAVYPISKGANFCPNCGANMRGDTD